jgi:putative DNA primase/helicase
VLIWSGEDDPRDTLVPRLIACGADLARILFVGSVTEEDGTRASDPARDADLLRGQAAVMDPPPALLIVDPIVSAANGDSHKNAEVRRGLQPLVDLATVVRCVVLGISHFTKGTAGRDPVERVTGSLAFGALARVILAAAKVAEEDGGGRVLARAKNNLRPDAGGFGYDLEPPELPDHPGVHTTRILWGAPLEGTARELLRKAESVDDPDERSALEDAKAWLRHTPMQSTHGQRQVWPRLRTPESPVGRCPKKELLPIRYHPEKLKNAIFCSERCFRNHHRSTYRHSPLPARPRGG